LLQALAQWLAVIDDHRLGFARRHQALQVGQHGAGLGTGLIELLDQRLQPLAGLRVTRCGQSQLGAALQQPLRKLAEGREVLAHQEHGVRADPVDREEFGRGLADALGQHHQLPRCVNLVAGGVLLYLQGSHRLGNLQQVARLAVDLAQRGPDLGEHLLLRDHAGCTFLGALHARQDRVQRVLIRRIQWVQPQGIVTRLEPPGGATQYRGAVLHIGKGLRVAHHGLCHRLGKPLRLHQRLADRTHLLADLVGHAQGKGRHGTEQDQGHGQTDQQYLLVLVRRPRAQHGQVDVVAGRLRQQGTRACVTLGDRRNLGLGGVPLGLDRGLLLAVARAAVGLQYRLGEKSLEPVNGHGEAFLCLT
jgi:hypothetical protein